MIDRPRDNEILAIAKMQEIIDEAVDAEVDAVTIEFAKEGGLEVIFMVGNTGVGGILVDRILETEVMGLIHERAELEEKTAGVMHWESHGQNLEIRVEQYDSFGENAYTLTFPKLRN
jgi:hypothetical protein